jgi:(2Fe-2S) ferredoxin
MSRPDPPLYYRRHVFCCVNTRADDHPRGCCSARGSVKLRAHMKARAKQRGLTDVRINASQCLDRCEFGPTMVIYPEGVWYAARTVADVDEIIETHLVGGSRVERLMLMPDQPLPDEGADASREAPAEATDRAGAAVPAGS